MKKVKETDKSQRVSEQLETFVLKAESLKSLREKEKLGLAEPCFHAEATHDCVAVFVQLVFLVLQVSTIVAEPCDSRGGN